MTELMYILLTIPGVIVALAIWVILVYLIYRASDRRTRDRLTWGKPRIEEVEEVADDQA